MNKTICLISSLLFLQFPSIAVETSSNILSQESSQQTYCSIEGEEEVLSPQEIQVLANKITVKVTGNNNGGSGTLLGKQGNSYLVLTNAHVVRGVNKINLKTFDGKEYPAEIVPQSKFKKSDLALLKFQANQDYCLPSIAKGITGITGLEVIAAGYSADKGEIVFRSGEVKQVSEQALKEGYQIGYSSDIDQGMSGGAIISSDGTLMGINGKSSYPILNTGYVYENGKKPTDAEIQEMRKLSWGIPTRTVLAQVNKEVITAYNLPLPESSPNLPEVKLTGWLVELGQKAKQFTVRIDSSSGTNGSGLIIAKEGDTYTVLTTAHVVCESENGVSPCPENNYEILTHDGKKYSVDKSTIKTEEGVDLGVLKFKSQNNYQIAEFGNYQLNKIQEVFVTGFPKLVNSSSFYFSPGLIFNKEEGLLQTQQSDFQNSNDGKLQTASSFTGGYELVYTNITYGGMGGSPVLDSQGRVIGIHGLAEGETAIDEQTGDCGVNFGCQVQVGYSLGIPIPTLLSSIHRLGLNPNLLKVKNSSPPKLNETQLISFAQVFPQNFSTGNAKASQWLERGNILWLINQFEKAIAAFNEVIKQKPSFIHIAYYQKARVLSFQKKYQEALAASIQAVKLKPNFVAAWKHLSAVYRKLNKPNKALLAIDKAIKLQPKNPSLYNNKWAILKDLRLYLEAELNINKAIQIAPRAVFYNNRGTLYEEQKKWELAEADYSKSIQINPSYPNAYYNRGNLYSTKKKWKLAEADFNKALRLNYYNKEIYKRRGIVRYKLGDRKGAIEDYTELIKHNPEDAETYKNRAIARSEIGDKQGAILDIETAARLYRLQNNLPSYQQVLNVLRILKDSSDKNISISSEQTSDSHKNVHSIAQNITVRISDFGSDGNNFQSSGSGVIINKQGNTYYVLTCAHVIPYEEVRKYHITTPDNKHYLIEANKVYKHPELDIAVIQFTSKESYKVATLANHPIEKFRWIYVAGWSNPSNIESASWLVNPGLVFSKEIGSLDTMNSLSFTKGYELIYTNMTYKGMSGGAILDSKGHLIGIHGKSEGKILYTQNAEKIELHLGYSLGISIDTVLSLDTELQLNSKFLKIESTTPIVDNKFPLVPIENMSVKNNSSISKEKMSEVLLRPGNQLWRLGKFDEANAAFDEIVKLEPTASILVKSYYAKSLALKYQKKYSEALNALNKAIKNKDDFYEAWREKGEILYILGRYSEALSSIEKSIEVNNKNFQEYKDFSLYSWRGQLLHKLKQYSKAIEAYSQAIQIKPHPFNYLNRGIALFHLGRQKEAIKNYTEAIKSKPNYAEAYFNRGIILSNTGDKEKAIQDFTAAIKPEGATIPTKT